MNTTPPIYSKIKQATSYLLSIFFIVIIVLSLLWIFYSLFLILQGSAKAAGIPTRATVYLFFLKLTGTLAFVLIGVTMITGALRSFLISFYKKASFWETHTKWTSSLGIGLAISHLIIYILYKNRLHVSVSLNNFLPANTDLKAENNLIFIALLALFTVTTNTVITHIPGITGKKWWRPLHILNYLALVLILLHAFFLGTDSGSIYYRTIYVVFLILVILGIVYRVVKVIKKRQKGLVVPVKPIVASKQTELKEEDEKLPVLEKEPSVKTSAKNLSAEKDGDKDFSEPKEGSSLPDLSPPVSKRR